MQENPNYLCDKSLGTSVLQPHTRTQTQLRDVISVRRINRQRVHFVRVIGEGAFGRVYLGVCKGLVNDEASTKVAIKTLKVRYETIQCFE